MFATTKNVLIVLAHQDDEAGIITRIRYEVDAGSCVWIMYLTDGAKAVPSAIRDRESLVALKKYGVDPSQVIFLSDDRGRIGDGQLMENLARARDSALRKLHELGRFFDLIYAIDWEGGHADHDAAHLIAIALRSDLQVPEFLTFSLYNAYRRCAGFFRVMSFVPSPIAILRRPLSLKQALDGALVIFLYPSQWRTWIALGPGWIYKTLVRREERLRPIDYERIQTRPHDGPLLYESLFKLHADYLLSISEEFRRNLLEPT